jgi:hypothetical protein
LRFRQLAILAERMEIGIQEAIDASSVKPYAFMRFDPRGGMGGHFLPVDCSPTSGPRAFLCHRIHRARGQDQPAGAISLSGAN